MPTVHRVRIMPAKKALTPSRFCRTQYASCSALSRMTCCARNCIWVILRQKLESFFGSAYKSGYAALNISSASCGMRGSCLCASIRKAATSSDGALTMPSKMDACMGSSQPSPSIRLTLSPHDGFRKHIVHLESAVYSAPCVLCPWASSRSHVPSTKRPRRSTLNILLGTESMPTIPSPHPRLSPVTNINGLNKNRYKNRSRNNCNRVLEPVRNSKDSSTFFSSIKPANFSV